MSALDIIIVILLISWIAGFGFKVAGGFIHILLVIALIVLIFRLLGISTPNL